MDGDPEYILYLCSLRAAPQTATCGYTSMTVFGEPSGTNPVGGSAVWEGHARGLLYVRDEYSRTVDRPVEGSSRLVADFASATIDVDITGLGGHDISWNDLQMYAGQFLSDEPNYLSGSFYGDNHEGAAGEFSMDSEETLIIGVFGALRQ